MQSNTYQLAVPRITSISSFDTLKKQKTALPTFGALFLNISVSHLCRYNKYCFRYLAPHRVRFNHWPVTRSPNPLRSTEDVHNSFLPLSSFLHVTLMSIILWTSQFLNEDDRPSKNDQDFPRYVFNAIFSNLFRNFLK